MSERSTFLVSSAVLLLALGAQNPARCQCQDWFTGIGLPGMDGDVLALTVLDLGGGQSLYAGGYFTHAGVTSANHVARWDGSSWHFLGSGTNGAVVAMTVFDDGSGPALYAGGLFTYAGGAYAPRIAKWSGSSWSALGNGTDYAVNALAVFDDGGGPALYAAGDFTTAGGAPALHLAKWSGSSWSPLGSGTNDSVQALAVFDDGGGPALYAGGLFTTAGGAPASQIAKWNGSSWSPLGTGLIGGGVYALALYSPIPGSGIALYAGGLFNSAGGAPASNIARWNGSSWSALGLGVNGRVTALAAFDEGRGRKLYAGGAFTTAGSVYASHVARWNASSWAALDAGVSGDISALAVFNNGADDAPDLYAGGSFTEAGVSFAHNIAEWRGCVPIPGLPFCYGDGTAGLCPCLNNGIFSNGCENSAGTGGALLTASGRTQPDHVVLQAGSMLPSVLAVFLQSEDSMGSVLSGDGLLCLGPGYQRLYFKHTSNYNASAPGPGDPSITARSAALGVPISAGSYRYYQVWYRDNEANFCPAPAGSVYNYTNGYKIQW
jgi:hypothetical protein